MEDVANQTIVLAQAQLIAVAGHDAGRVLSAVLQNRQRIIDGLVNRFD
jgi:hypothetical protein